MRQLIQIFFLFAIGAESLAQAPMNFIKDQIKSNSMIQTQALRFILQQRCIQYFHNHDKNSLQTLTECQREVRSFLQALDIRVVQLQDPQTQNQAPVTIAYHHQLVQMMNEVSTHHALSEIEFSLQLSIAKPFDLYTVLMKFFKNDQLVVQFLAVLFQDTSRGQAAVQYLKTIQNTQSSLFLNNLAKLESVHQLFFELQRTRTWKLHYRLYPLSIENSSFKLSPTQYHFYVISQAVIKMSSEVRPKSADKIVFIATVFNYLYERFYHFNWNSSFNDQKTLSKKSSEDVNLGFLAALYGIGIHPSFFQHLPKVNQNPQEFFRTTLSELRLFFP